MELEGIIKVIEDTGTFGNNGFQKREFVLTTEEQYPQHVLIELVQDKCSILDKYAVGEKVKVSINIRGREWVNPQGETKYFNSIQAWRIEKVGFASEGVPPVPPKEVFEPAGDLTEEDPDDMPF
ncbi:DUF3127 domain-containing protein [Flagellimonas flava]|uniref:DUF3127 domain-containing protein n=1 Tax=Flagellimonas flava TaxID=570519 RepID=UPI003D6618C6